MAPPDGSYRLGPATGRLVVKTYRTGMGAKIGHDLVIEATRWEGAAVVDSAHPENSSITVTVDLDSLEVREGTGGVKPLTESDKADIEQTIRKKIFPDTNNRKAGYQSTRIVGSPDSFSVEGDLTIMGTTRPTTLRGAVSEDGRVGASTTVQQSRWAIKPYSAFLGALKLKDEVDVEISLTLSDT